MLKTLLKTLQKPEEPHPHPNPLLEGEGVKISANRNYAVCKAPAYA